MVNPKLIDVINKRLKNKTFDIEFFNIPFEIKVEITGQKEMISVGELKDYLTYTVFIQPHVSEDYNNIINRVFKDKVTNVVSYNMNSLSFGINNGVNEILHNIIIYYKDDLGSILTKIVNEQVKDQITESFLIEGKYDGITRKLVKDIIKVFKSEDSGSFTLPEYFEAEMTYDFGGAAAGLTLELELEENSDLDEFEVDGEYYRDENTISIKIDYNPEKKLLSIQKLIGELNETIRHEIEHMSQKHRGYKYRQEPEEPLKYYTQKREIEAQVAGFRRRAKQERRPVEDIMREWFKKYEKRHRLSPDQIEKVIKKLLRQFPQNSSN
jgi:hypothetical protein